MKPYGFGNKLLYMTIGIININKTPIGIVITNNMLVFDLFIVSDESAETSFGVVYE